MSKSSTIKTKVRGYEMEITFDYTPACRGVRERGTGLQLEPDEPAIIEITGLVLCDPADFCEMVVEEVNITIEDVEEAIANWEP